MADQWEATRECVHVKAKAALVGNEVQNIGDATVMLRYVQAGKDRTKLPHFNERPIAGHRRTSPEFPEPPPPSRRPLGTG